MLNLQFLDEENLTSSWASVWPQSRRFGLNNPFPSWRKTFPFNETNALWILCARQGKEKNNFQKFARILGCPVTPRYMRNKKKVTELFCPWLDASYWLPLPWIHPILQLQQRQQLFFLWLHASFWLPLPWMHPILSPTLPLSSTCQAGREVVDLYYFLKRVVAQRWMDRRQILGLSLVWACILLEGQTLDQGRGFCG